MNKPFLISLILSIILFLGLINILFLNNKPNTIPQIPKPKNNNSINIVFTTDKKYSPYLKVALKSLILNKNKDSIYNIYILSIDLNKKTQKELKTFKQQNVEITTIPLKLSMLKNVGNYRIIARRHVSRADLFKFFIPEIFQNFNKILYLDSDILVLGDVSKIYNYDLEDKYIGAVQESYLNEEFKYNCGVILFDIKKCSENNITKKLIQAKNNDKNHIYITQPFFHEVLDESKVKTMPFEFNRFSTTDEKEFKKFNYKNLYYKNDKTINSLDDVDKRAIIIHFLAYKKPWQYEKIPFANQWWYYAHLINPNWKVEKKRNTIQNFVLALQISIAANKEKKFSSLNSAFDNFIRNFKYLIKEDK